MPEMQGCPAKWLRTACEGFRTVPRSSRLRAWDSTTGDFFNVQTSSVDMHIRWREIGAIFAVEKPGHLDGRKTLSFQFFDRSGHAAFKVFLGFRAMIPAEKEAQFVQVREEFKSDQHQAITCFGASWRTAALKGVYIGAIPVLARFFLYLILYGEQSLTNLDFWLWEVIVFAVATIIAVVLYRSGLA